MWNIFILNRINLHVKVWIQRFDLAFLKGFAVNILQTEGSGAKKVFSQPPIMQVVPPERMRVACTFHHR